MSHSKVPEPFQEFSSENPFGQRPRRENFPSIDEALRVGLDGIDESISSHSSTANLSIGARAALNDHLRHVAKYGLDSSRMDEHQGQEDSNVYMKSPLDEAWDRLLDDNISRISLSDTMRYRSADDLLRLERVFSTHDEGEEGIEIFAETSSDFFNSSRVHLLQTPEKHRARKIEAVTLRRDGTTAEESFSSSGASEHSGQSSNMLRLFQQHALPYPTQQSADQSFASFSGVDVSRISAVDVSRISNTEGIMSPDSSFLQQDHRTTIMSPDSPFAYDNRNSAILSPESPLDQQHRDMQHLLPPIEKTPSRHFRGATTTLSPRKFSPQKTPRRRPSHTLFSTPRRSPRKGQKENHFEALTLSPIASRAADTAARFLQQKESNNANEVVDPTGQFLGEHVLETTSSFFADTWESIKEAAAEVSIGTIFEYDKSQESDISSLRNSSSEKHSSSDKKQSSSSSAPKGSPTRSLNDSGERMLQTVSLSSEQKPLSSSSFPVPTNYSSILKHDERLLRRSVSDTRQLSSSSVSRRAPPLSVGDRKLFRTVVPTRVFMDEPHEFPEVYDSFSVPAPKVSRSLLSSFEKAAAERMSASDPN